MAAERAVARILNKHGEVAGAGVLLGPRVVLTCAHVVADWDPRGRLDFPIEAKGESCLANVVERQPGGHDLAVLELEGDPPAEVEPATWVSPDPLSLNRHKFQAFGFPEKLEEGINSNHGVISGRLPDGLVQLQGERGAAFPIEHGFSGGPVWDFDVSEQGGVVGLVVKKLGIPGVEVAAMIPLQTILGADPDLAGLLKRGHPGADSIPARSWAVLDTRRRGRWCVTVDEMNFVLVDEVPATWDQQGLPFSAYADRSLVLSADGFVAASVAAQKLQIWTVSARTGHVSLWSETHELDLSDPRVIAVGRKGDREVWCAVVDRERYVRRASLTSKTLTQWKKVARHGQDEEASGAFLGASLLVLEEGDMMQVLPGGARKPWHPPALPLAQRRVIAFDTAILRGRRYAAILTQPRQPGAGTFPTLFVPATGGHDVQPGSVRLRASATSVSLVRSQSGDLSTACVFVGTETKAVPEFPFQPSVRSAPA